jgi:hypothetical protein
MKPLALPTNWTGQQALAVYELLDELRDRIGALYEQRLLDAYRDRHAPAPSTDHPEPFNDPLPF